MDAITRAVQRGVIHIRTRICDVCGKEFATNSPGRVECCSEECRRKRELERRSAYSRAMFNTTKPTQVVRKKKVESLGCLEKAARARGLSYGQLEARRYMGWE